MKRNLNLNPIINKHYCLVILLLWVFLPIAISQGNNEFSPGNNRFNTDFNPSMAIIIVVIISAFFFMGFFTIYIRQCGGSGDQDRSTGQLINGGRSRRGIVGLDHEIIDTFPIFLYSDVKEHKLGKGSLECAVCLNEFEDIDELRLLPKCDHVFHPECIDAWLSSHITCPVCRSNLKPEQQESATSCGGGNRSGGGGGGDDGATTVGTELPVSVSDTQTTGEERPTSEVTIEVIEITQNPNEIPFQNRPTRSKPKVPLIIGKFPRSHSTGHSLIQPGENHERFTLRLPEDVRKQIVNGKLNRTISCLAFPTGDGSVSGGSNRGGGGYRSGGEGSSRGKNYKLKGIERGGAKSDRWVFSRTPPFFIRNSSSSVRSLQISEGIKTPTKILSSGKKTTFDCLGTKSEEENDSVLPSSSNLPV